MVGANHYYDWFLRNTAQLEWHPICTPVITLHPAIISIKQVEATLNLLI